MYTYYYYYYYYYMKTKVEHISFRGVSFDCIQNTAIVVYTHPYSILYIVLYIYIYIYIK